MGNSVHLIQMQTDQCLYQIWGEGTSQHVRITGIKQKLHEVYLRKSAASFKGMFLFLCWTCTETGTLRYKPKHSAARRLLKELLFNALKNSVPALFLYSFWEVLEKIQHTTWLCFVKDKWVFYLAEWSKVSSHTVQAVYKIAFYITRIWNIHPRHLLMCSPFKMFLMCLMCLISDTRHRRRWNEMQPMHR